MLARTGWFLILGGIASVIACHEAAVPESAPAPEPATATAALVTCDQYPIAVSPAESGQGAAQAELSSLSPAATMTWNDDTGTLSAVSQLALRLPGCSDGQDVMAQLVGTMSAHPQLFQLAPDEWQLPPAFDCRFVDGFTTISMGRQRLAGRPVAKDVFVYTLNRVNGGVELAAVNGVYLPVAGAALGDAMAACNSLTASAATTTARATALEARTYSQCVPIGALTYTPQANDSFAFAPEESWSWEPASGQAHVTGQRTLRVTVNPANYTPALLASDARCPVPGGDGDEFTVGFDITFDVHTGAIVNVKPGLDCVVC